MFGATTDRRLISSELKKRSAILMMPFLPSFLLSRLLPMVMFAVTSSRWSIATTVNSLSDGIWSITVPFLSAATCNSFFSFMFISFG